MLEKMDSFFENRVAGYDEHMLTEIEGADEFYKFTALQLPAEANTEVLDLGCGYFALNPRACVTGIDLSEAMLRTLAEKFLDKSLRLINGSYFDEPFEAGRYAAAVSVESLHHFTGNQKRALYKKVFHALAEDGYFILTDYFAETDELEKEYFDTLKRLKQAEKITDDAFYHYDTPLTTAHEIEILREAGFSRVSILKNWGATHTIKAVRQKSEKTS